eukprot:300585-Rhodomonas_salina.1
MQTVWNEGCRGLERKQQDRSPKRIYHHDACKPMRKQKRAARPFAAEGARSRGREVEAVELRGFGNANDT